MILLELAYQAGLNPKKVANTAGGEYHSACPSCGGSDRFYIQPYKPMGKSIGTYRCRQCCTYGDAIKFAREFLNYSFQEAVQRIGAMIGTNILLDNKYIPKTTTLCKPPTLWTEQASMLADQAHKILLHNDKMISFLTKRGLPLDAIQQYKFGLLTKDQSLSRDSWGLKEELKDNGQLRLLWIPQGLLIPIYELNKKIIRLKIRRSNWKKGDTLPKYIAISGNMRGLSIIGKQQLPTVIVVESELDAYAIDFVIGDKVCTIAVGGCVHNPDNVTNHIAKSAKKLLVFHDNDEAGKKMLQKWKNLYSQAQAITVPFGKDAGEYIAQGGNIKEFLSQFI